MRLAVAGATGTVGRLIVEQARERGHEVTEIARSRGVDLLTGAGLDAAMADVEVVVDAASVGTLRSAEAISFFRRASGSLLSAARRAGTAHAVLLSIVGVDRNPHGYYAGKVAQEDVFRDGGVPWTIVRATQFHEFAAQVAAQARLGRMQLAPRARVQPVAAAEVAAHLIEVAEGAPRGRSADITGPREEELADLIRAQSAHDSGRSRAAVIPVRLPTAQMRGMRAGLNLPGRDARRLGPTFGEWLASRATP